MTGLDRLMLEHFQRLRGLRVGLVAHPASVDSRFQHVVDLLATAREVKLEIVFGPEHGWLGHAQDLEAVANCVSNARSPRVVSLYGDHVESLRPTADHLAGLDVLIIDLQDIGARYYTFQATMLYCLEAANELGMRVLILDRPNPLGGYAIEGPRLSSGYESFVGPHDIATRHGMTLGELALFYQHERQLNRVSLEIVRCEGWNREMLFDDTRLPWILPSPNMPTLDTAMVYPGQCLFEGTNLSEGRGTTRPFELCGAPWLSSDALAKRLNDERLPGAFFRSASFQPTFQKHAGKSCGGVQLHVTHRSTFQPIRTSLAMLAVMRELSAENFKWRTEIYEFVSNPIAIDLLFGSNRERLALEAGVAWRDIAMEWVKEEKDFESRRKDFLLYPGSRD